MRRLSSKYKNLIWFIFDNETGTIRDVFLILLKTWLFDVWLVFFIFNQVAFPCGFLRWCDSPISISQRERVSHLEFSHENQSSSPLCLANFDHLDSVVLSWWNYCKAWSRTIFGKYLGIFHLYGCLFSIVNCHVSPSPQHSTGAILLRWYTSKLSIDK